MPAQLKLVGRTFGRLTVLNRVATTNGHVSYLCRCVCGIEKSVRGSHLTAQKITSCGTCQRNEPLEGRRFGRLVVVRLVGRSPSKSAIWLCVRDCKQEVSVISGNLNSGGTRSCGCLFIEARAISRPIHGHSTGNTHSRTYNSWNMMLQRTSNPKAQGFKRYGAKGITVCNGLRNFSAFLAILGERPDGTSLGRYLDTGNYSCGACDQCKTNGWLRNCEWAARAQQGAEQRGRNAMMRYRALKLLAAKAA
jgi:hypothetical protein